MYKKSIISLLLAAWLSLALAAPCLAAGTDMVAVGHDVRVNVDDIIDGNVVVFGGNVNIAGEVMGDAVVFGGNIKLRSTAIVRGDTISIGGKVETTPGAKVIGQIVRGVPAFDSTYGSVIDLGGFSPIGLLLKLLGLLACAVIVAMGIAFFSRQMEAMDGYIAGNFFKAFGAGLLGILCFIPMIVLLAITLIGIPVVPIFIFVFTAAVVFGWVGAALLVGRRLLSLLGKSEPLPLFGAITGSIVISLVSWIPLIGGLATFLAGSVGLGAVLMTKFGTMQPWFAGRVAPEPVPTVEPAHEEEAGIDPGTGGNDGPGTIL